MSVALIKVLADFVYRLRYEDLDEKTIFQAKLCVLDGLANMIYGRYSEAGRRAVAYAAANDALPKDGRLVSILGESGKYAKDVALEAHGIMARCSDLDDGFRFAMGHPGSVQVPFILTMGELLGADGKACITALVAGYEIHGRLGEAMNPAMYRERGLDATGVCGSVGAAAVAAKLMGLPAEQIADAMGIASLFTGALTEYQNDGTSGKYLCSGWACVDGARAAALAKAGFTGPVEALEGKKGYFQGLRGSRLDLSAVTDGLGREYKINSAYFKQHACMRGLHAAVDALLALREEYGLRMDNVDYLEINGTSFTQRLSKPSPKTIVAAQSSMQFSLAVALKNGHVCSEEVMIEGMRDPEIMSLSERSVFRIDEEIEAYLKDNPTHYTAVRLKVCLKDGSAVERWNPIPEGDVEHPYTRQQMMDKFCRLIAGTPYEAKSEALVENIFALETLASTEPLLRL